MAAARASRPGEVTASELGPGFVIRRHGSELEIKLAIPWAARSRGGPGVFVIWRVLGSEPDVLYGDGVFARDMPFRLIRRPIAGATEQE
ncbi:hypothetical protein [Actinomadura sp. K4S16]|uniref:hypothetical protein n=1 Tax=Actinomadura sp. K4S16 TaxID=1316147 RepID=UPI0011EE6343|nr:hypothetical protein [Actinomadura sp. K4S16]